MEQVTLTKEETIKVLEEFYEDCLDYWLSQPDNDGLGHSKAMAKKDLATVTNNPLKPTGELLDVEAKKEFISGLI